MLVILKKEATAIFSEWKERTNMGKEEVILIFKESGFLFKGPMMQRYNILCNVSKNEKLLNSLILLVRVCTSLVRILKLCIKKLWRHYFLLPSNFPFSNLSCWNKLENVWLKITVSLFMIMKLGKTQISSNIYEVMGHSQGCHIAIKGVFSENI